MHDLVAEALRSAASKAAEIAVERLFDRPTETKRPDPITAAQAAIDGFLCALANRDWDTLYALSEPTWAGASETAELMDGTLQAAPPLSWAFRECHVPEDWVPGAPLPWLVAELVVTFDVETAYETIPAVLQAVQANQGWLICHLEWGSPPDESQGFDSALLSEEMSVIYCPRCDQALRVPAHLGRLRVTCPKCRNVQFFDP